MATLALTALVLLLTTQDAYAQGATLQAVSLPKLSTIVGWFQDPHWGHLPRQAGGTAEGLSHRATAAATHSGKGVGSAPGKGRGELDPYHPYAKAAKSGPSRTVDGFAARTSRRNAAKSTQTATVFDNADGTTTRRVTQTPVNYQDASGAWQPIDTRVHTGSDGRWHEAANSVGVDLAATSATGPLASFAADSGHSVSYTLQGVAPVTGTVAGSVVTYANALPGTDVELAPTASGLKEAIVLHSAAAANSWTFPLTLKGLTPVQVKDGSIDLRDGAGKTIERIPAAYAYDSKVDPRSGDPATTHAVTYQLIQQGASPALRVTLNAGWLHDAARRFPVTVDPTVADGWTTTYAESGADGDHSSEQTIKVGSYDSGPHSAIGFSNHWYSAYDATNVTVTAASVHLFDTWASTCTAERFDVALVTSAWTPSGVTTYPGPSHGASIGNLTPAVPNACANSAADRTVGDWLNVPLTASAIQGWMSGSTPDRGLAIYAATTDTLHWKQFGSFNDQDFGPWIEITYTGNVGPQIYQQSPNNNATAHTVTPELTALAGGANARANTTTQYDFQVYDTTNAKVADSGLVAAGDWTVPAGKLAWGRTYYWAVQAYDGGLYSPAPAWYALNIQVPQPVITSGLSQNSSEHGFDATTGNYTTSDTDASISTAGPGLEVVRDYNSRDPRWTGSFGAGWSAIVDARVTEQYTPAGVVTSAVVTYPDGSQVGFGRNGDGTFSPPAGRFATFKAVTGGYTLTDKNDTTYTFTQSLGSGGYGITSVADANARALTFTWAGGQITQMASALSGRALHLTWTTPSGAAAPHVAAVVTDPATATDQNTAQTWTYGYTGDQLSTVCAPNSATECTQYGYTSGSQYQNAALDLDPHAMWPLSEPSGSTAKDAILANEGTTNATYSNVTLGQPGPVTGGTASAAGFNGTSSNVVLPNNTGNNTDTGTISLWFKTSTGPGVLYSYSSQSITAGNSAGYYTPSLYVGTDGKLNGEFWYSGGMAPITTSAAVTDGRWHHVVLAAAGNSQTLYLDSAKVGSVSGTVSYKDGEGIGTNQPFNYLGAGYLGGKWPDEPHQSASRTGYATYFNGSIADAAWYDKPLVAADVSTLYKYGTHAASLLTSITRPSGKAFVTMAYDPATTTLTQVTDENGGVWKLGTPTVSGSSQTYRGAVLGGAPAEYFRLGEVPGASAAVDETRGGNGTYSGVTLGNPGPFSDQQTAAFNGTTSRIQIPDAQTGSTAASAEVWFATTHGGGILLNQQSAPIGGTVTSTTPQLWVGSDNKLYGGFYTTSGSVQMVTTGTVTDGKWHHAVLSASPASQTLYLDGTQAATKTTSPLSVSGRSTDYLGAGTTGSGWSGLTNGTVAYFNGSLAEAAVYRSALTAQDAAAHFQAAKNSTGLLPVETVKVVSPADATTTYQYDVENNNRQLSETDGLGNKTSFGYDTGGFEHTVINPNGAMTTTGHDVRGNVVSSTTCQNQAANACSTQYYSYYPDDTTAQLTTADPRNDVLVTERDGRSASATDNTYLTSFSYDTAGDETATTTAPVAGFPSGRTATTVFSDGSASYPAADSGTVPKGLPVRTVSPGGAVNAVSYLHTGDIASTTDAAGLVTSYTYDGLGQVLTKKVVSDTYPAGLKTTYVYDKAGQVVEEDDPQLTDRVTGATHAARTTTVFDGDGNVTSQTVADASGGDTSRTQSQTYDAYDHLASQSDANAAAAASNGNTNTFSYDLSGNKIKEVSSAGTTTQYTYDDNGHLLTQGLMFTGDPVNPSAPTLLTESSRAYDPAGRLASVTDSMGNTTAYTYTDNGLTSTVTKKDAAGTNSFVLQAMTYDAAANPLSQTSDNGATVTNFTVDAASRTTSTTVDPTGVDRVTSVAYTPDDHVATQNDHDSSGWDRTTSSTYDVMGNTLSQTLYGDASGHPAGWWKLDQSAGSTVTDASGTGNTAAVPSSGVTWNNSAATFAGTSTGTGSVIATNSPVLDTSASYSVSAWVNLSDASTYRTFVAQGATTNSSFYLQYSKALNSYTFIAPSSDSASPAAYASAHASAAPALNTWTHLVGVFNAANGAMSLYVNGALAGTGTNTVPWTGNGPMTIGGAKLTGGAVSNVTAGAVGNVQAYPRALTAADITTLYGNGRTGGTVGSSSQQTTKWTYDKRGLPTSMTDANTNTTSYAYDEAGNLAVTTAPTVQVETDGGAPVSTHPVTASGFNTFGEAVEETDPTGNTTTTVYDANGNKVSETLPPYTPVGSSTPITATSAWAYDSDGNKISSTSPSGRTTSSLYDQLGDVAQSTAADGTRTHATYDTNGEKLSVTDATGAVTQATYDYLGRPLTSTTLERFPSTRTLTSTKSYAATAGNPYGANLSSTTTPGGVTSSYGYNRAGDVTSATDGAGNTTQYTYDFQGNRQKTILPDGTWTQTDYNAAGQPASSKQYDVLNNLLKQTSQVYDGVGNITSATDANGNTSRFTYDAAGTVTQEIQPVTPTTSITTAFGYDAAGNRTRFTDGRGNSWHYAYTPWGQQQSVTEPSTSTYSSPADSTTTNVYDADGQLVSAMSPGGVSTSMTYDQNGALTSASGTGAEAATATRSFTYDDNGQILTADSSEAGITGQKDHQASTHETFGYDDRGDLLSATGSAGSSSFTYNNDAAPLTRADAAGTTSYGYDTAGRMNALSDAATGTALTYGYNSVNQVASVKYGATGQSRTYTYNSAHDLTGDTLVQGAGTLATISYGYDKNGNITSKNTTGVAGASANTYTYDQADRLTGWNNGTVNTAYSYDASGNRTQVGANVYTYDARDQLTSDGVHTYAYSARGTMTSDTSSAGGTVAYSTDAQGNQITAGGHSYTLDATGRNITDANSADTSTRTFQYSGAGNTIAADGNYTYSYDPSGALIGINVNGATSTSTGVLAMTDGHNDVVGTFSSGATTLAGSASYDPTGNTTAKNALSGNLGFQSGWTEADTGKVGTASRWYNPATGTFMNKDSVSLNPVPHSVSANPFAYVNDNPLAGSDPSGQCSWYDAACEARAAYHEVKSAVTTTYTAAAATYHYVAAKVATVVQKAKRTVQKAVNRLHDAYRSTVRYGRRLYAYSSRHARRLYRSAVNHLHSAYHAASSTVHRIVKATKRGATALKKTARKAYTAAVKGAKTAATFVKHHAAAITSFVVSTAVFAGCEALTVGVGSIGCAAIAGAAGSLVEQGFKCAEAGGAACSVGAFAGSAVTGAIAGALGGALGSLGGKLLSKLAPKAMRAVGGLFGKGATEAEETAASDATQSATSKAETDAAGSRSETGGCPTHSFTGNTRVLMANGATQAIDTVKVGDTIANSVPGQTGTQAHTVTAVIVTTTDHDFVDVAIKRSTGSATKAVAKSALKKTVVGLAASAALFATFGATHTAADRHDLSATAPVAAQVNTQTSDHLTTTFHHPFYDETQASFTDAKDLHPGDILQTPTGTAEVTDVRLFHANTTTYDLTIGDLHTYYVLAGATPVLVHNCNVALGWQNKGKLDGWAKMNEFTTYSNVSPRDYAQIVEKAVADSNVTLHVNMTGLNELGGFMAAAQRGLIHGELGHATDYELSMVARALATGQRGWNSIKFYSPTGHEGSMVRDADVPMPNLSLLRGEISRVKGSVIGYCHC
ncbi:LamG-like jellyroll fold domain-containing protein [Streptomyces sp. RKAG337]|uniref:LamG-like jellyroll fold domain-containing protein n=1 Tax=Streptomyces sp. RKAG337 TaxID=2893404 RepID=UPI0020349F78|nr:LamG-like jellyroll fold domain-containing protein [Streptomyces sp. RKAG337]MCM2429708.1 Teneurin-1 [Streptomyces sp. RKAG337]